MCNESETKAKAAAKRDGWLFIRRWRKHRKKSLKKNLQKIKPAKAAKKANGKRAKL
jgi:hypothetical protein